MADETKVDIRVQIGQHVWKGEVDASFEDAPISGLILRVGDDKQSDGIGLVEATTEERKKRLQDLIFQKSATKTVSIGNLVEVVFQTLSGADMLELDSASETVRPPTEALRKWDFDYEMIRTLAGAIKTFDGSSIGATRKEREKFVLELNQPTILYLARRYNEWMAELAALQEPEVIEDILPK